MDPITTKCQILQEYWAETIIKKINLFSVFVRLATYQGRVSGLYLAITLLDYVDWQLAFMVGFWASRLGVHIKHVISWVFP